MKDLITSNKRKRKKYKGRKKNIPIINERRIIINIF